MSIKKLKLRRIKCNFCGFIINDASPSQVRCTACSRFLIKILKKLSQKKRIKKNREETIKPCKICEKIVKQDKKRIVKMCQTKECLGKNNRIKSKKYYDKNRIARMSIINQPHI